MRRIAIVSLGFSIAVLGGGVRSLAAQQDPDPNKSRPPLLLELTREERIATAVHLYLKQFIQAIQRADTVALASLVPDEVIPAEERPVAERAGCPSLGRAVVMLRASRAGRSENPELPLRMIRLEEVNVSLSAARESGSVAEMRIQEHAPGQVLYAVVSAVFSVRGDAIVARRLEGGLVGLCGLALSR